MARNTRPVSSHSGARLADSDAVSDSRPPRSLTRCRSGVLAAATACILIIGACALPGSVSEPAPEDSAATAASPSDAQPTAQGGVQDASPALTTLAPGSQKQVLFTAPVVAGEQDRFLVRSLLVVAAATTRLFIGQTLECTGPNLTRIDGLEVGRNVDPDTPIGTQLRGMFIFEPTAAGEWECRTLVRVSEPGRGGLLRRLLDAVTGLFNRAPAPSLTLQTEQANPVVYSQLRVSAPLPEWAAEVRPASTPVPVQSGESATISVDVDGIPTDVGRVEFAAILSISTCIEADYPKACAEVQPRDRRGSSTILPTLTITQYGSGSSCLRATATAAQGAVEQVITWQEHHGTVVFALPEVRPAPDSDCASRFRVDVTVTVVEGNGVVLEPGVALVPRSLVIALPSADL